MALKGTEESWKREGEKKMMQEKIMNTFSLLLVVEKPLHYFGPLEVYLQSAFGKLQRAQLDTY